MRLWIGISPGSAQYRAETGMPITLTREDVEQLAQLIQNLPGFDGPEARRAILVGAFLGYPRGAALVENLSLPNAPRLAANALLEALLKFELAAPGKQALGILLRHLESQVGEQGATYINELFSRYPLEATGDPPAGPRPADATTEPDPQDFVVPRSGARNDTSRVNLFRSAVSKRASRSRDGGTAVHTILFVQAWVRNFGNEKRVWVDVHAFDTLGRRLLARTVTLDGGEAAGNDGDFFVYDGVLHERFIPASGVPSQEPEVAEVQFLLYFQVEPDGALFADPELYRTHLQADSVVLEHR